MMGSGWTWRVCHHVQNEDAELRSFQMKTKGMQLIHCAQQGAGILQEGQRRGYLEWVTWMDDAESGHIQSEMMKDGLKGTPREGVVGVLAALEVE